MGAMLNMEMNQSKFEKCETCSHKHNCLYKARQSGNGCHNHSKFMAHLGNWRDRFYDAVKKDRNSEWFAPLKEIEWALGIKFSEELIRNNLHYVNEKNSKWFKNRHRYYIFPFDFWKYFCLKSCYGYLSIEDVMYCSKRKEIGKIINRLHYKAIIIYYTTSKRFQLYINVKSNTIKFTLRQFKKFNLYDLKKWLGLK